MSTLDSYLGSTVDQARHEAQDDGSASIEAHHLLLAIAGREGTVAQRVLASVGLDRLAIRQALDREFEHSLHAVGVSAAAFELPGVGRGRPPANIGASTRLAFERGFASGVRKKELRSAHLLLGILAAEVGTVPRALVLAGVDRSDLADRVRQVTG